MPKYNRNFELSVEDLDLIETALRRKKRILNESRMSGQAAPQETDQELHAIHDLLGRLHNQKVFYRPKASAYIGG